MTFLGAPGLLSSQTVKWQQRLSWFDEELDFTKYKVQIFRFAKYRFFILLDSFPLISSTNLAVANQLYCFFRGRKELEHPFQAMSAIMKLVDF